MQSIPRHDDAPSSATPPLAQQWLVASVCQPALDSLTPRPATAGWRQLSGRQKCDLACLALASVATIGFVFLPLLEDQRRPLLASTVVAVPVTAAPRLVSAALPRHVVEPRQPRPKPSTRRDHDSARLIASSRIATPSALVVEAMPAMPLAIRGTSSYVAADSPAAPRPGTLARLLVGTGRHRVQPFPTPAD